MFLKMQPGYQLVCSVVDILITPIKTENLKQMLLAEKHDRYMAI